MGVTETETKETIRSLVEGAHQSKKVIRWLTILMAFYIVLALGLGLFGLLLLKTNEQIQVESHAACLQSKRNSQVINNFLHQLIANAKVTDTLSPEEKRSRVKGYQKLLIDLPNCTKEN